MLERQLPEGPDRRRADVTSRRAVLELAGVVAIVLGASGCCLLRRRAPDPLTHALETDTGTSVGAGPRDTPEAERIREKRERDRARYGPDGYQLPQEKIDEVSGSKASSGRPGRAAAAPQDNLRGPPAGQEFAELLLDEAGQAALVPAGGAFLEKGLE